MSLPTAFPRAPPQQAYDAQTQKHLVLQRATHYRIKFSEIQTKCRQYINEKLAKYDLDDQKLFSCLAPQPDGASATAESFVSMELIAKLHRGLEELKAMAGRWAAMVQRCQAAQPSQAGALERQMQVFISEQNKMVESIMQTLRLILDEREARESKLACPLNWLTRVACFSALCTASSGDGLTAFSSGIISRRRLQELVSQIDPTFHLDSDVETLLTEMAEEFVESVTRFSCDLARHRTAAPAKPRLEACDVRLHLEHHWGINIPTVTADNTLALPQRTVNAAATKTLFSDRLSPAGTAATFPADSPQPVAVPPPPSQATQAGTGAPLPAAATAVPTYSAGGLGAGPAWGPHNRQLGLVLRARAAAQAAVAQQQQQQQLAQQRQQQQQQQQQTHAESTSPGQSQLPSTGLSAVPSTASPPTFPAPQPSQLLSGTAAARGPSSSTVFQAPGSALLSPLAGPSSFLSPFTGPSSAGAGATGAPPFSLSPLGGPVACDTRSVSALQPLHAASFGGGGLGGSSGGDPYDGGASASLMMPPLPEFPPMNGGGSGGAVGGGTSQP